MKSFLITFVILSLSISASAQVVITEIMYNLEGTDSKREWVEIKNVSGQSIEIEQYKFLEEGTNHSLTISQGVSAWPSGGVAVIASHPEVYLADWPDFSGTLLDSAFSLKNTGEELAVVSPGGVVTDVVIYEPEWGGAGDGHSLQLFDNNWQAAVPTPGSSNAQSTNTDEAVGQISQVQPVEQSSSTVETKTPSINLPTIYAMAKYDSLKTVAGGTINFRGEGFDASGRLLLQARYVWSLGDGGVFYGQSHSHTFHYPGDYVIILEILNGGSIDSQRFYVEVLPSSFFVSDATKDFIEITNGSDIELSLSGWMLSDGMNSFTLPINTFMIASTSVRFDRSITGLNGYDKSRAALSYPNGRVASRYVEPSAPPSELKERPPSPRLRGTSSATTTPGLDTYLDLKDPGLKSNTIVNSKQVVSTKQEPDPPTGQAPDETNQLASVVNTKEESRDIIWGVILILVIMAAVVAFMAIPKPSVVDEIDLIDE